MKTPLNTNIYDILSKIVKFIDNVDRDKSKNIFLEGGKNIENKQ